VKERTCLGCGADLTGTHGNRKWCSEHCRRTTLYGGTCEKCGARTDGSNGRAKVPKICLRCHRQRHAERNSLIEEMWDACEPVWHIAEKLGMTERSVYAWIENARRVQGRDIPHRALPRANGMQEWRRETVLRLARAGYRNQEIAERLATTAMSAGQMVAWLRGKGYDIPPRDRAQSKRRNEEAGLS